MLKNKIDSLVGITAPEILSGDWINHQPLSLAKLGKQDKVTLLDFWTINSPLCQQEATQLRKLWNKYRVQNLQVIGIHRPDFAFEQSPQYLSLTQNNFGINWPIVNDTNHVISLDYENDYYPRKILVDQSGKIVYDSIGLTDFGALEHEIQAALAKVGEKGFPKISNYQRTTQSLRPSIYLGDPNQLDEIVYCGSWQPTQDGLQYQGSSMTDFITIPVLGRGAGVVAESSTPAQAKILLNDKPLSVDSIGRDILKQDNSTFIEISQPRYYQLLNSARLHDQDMIKIFPLGQPLTIYALHLED
jgi:peroxiredoxin